MEIEKNGFSIIIKKEKLNEPTFIFQKRCNFITNIFLKKNIEYSKLLQLSYIWSNIYFLHAKYSLEIMNEICDLTKNTKFSINL